MEFTAGDPADNNAGYFFNGAMDVLKPYIKSGKMVVPSGQTLVKDIGADKQQLVEIAKAFSKKVKLLILDGSIRFNTTLARLEKICFAFLTKGVLLSPQNMTSLMLQNGYVPVMACGMLLSVTFDVVTSRKSGSK